MVIRHRLYADARCRGHICGQYQKNPEIELRDDPFLVCNIAKKVIFRLSYGSVEAFVVFFREKNELTKSNLMDLASHSF